MTIQYICTQTPDENMPHNILSWPKASLESSFRLSHVPLSSKEFQVSDIEPSNCLQVDSNCLPRHPLNAQRSSSNTASGTQEMFKKSLVNELGLVPVPAH